MIYLKNITQTQWVPVYLQRWNLFDLETREGETWETSDVFRSTFNAADIQVQFGGIVPSGESSESDFGHYMLMGFTLPAGLPDGSYEMKLEIVRPTRVAGSETYVVQVGGYTPSGTKQYDKTIEYEQYI